MPYFHIKRVANAEITEVSVIEAETEEQALLKAFTEIPGEEWKKVNITLSDVNYESYEAEEHPSPEAIINKRLIIVPEEAFSLVQNIIDTLGIESMEIK